MIPKQYQAIGNNYGMYRIGSILIVLFQFTTHAFAQYQLDTLSHRVVGPGMVHMRAVDPSGPWHINLFEADLTNPYLVIETLKADDRVRALETTSSMAARRNFEGHLAVGAVNGDFYGGVGEPINIQVVRGEIVKREASDRTAIGFTPENAPMMDFFSFSGEAILDDGTALALTGVNQVRGADNLILYNSFMGTSTGTNEFGTEVGLEMLDDWIVNDTLRAIVRTMETGVGNMAIPEDGAVLSGHGTASDGLLAGVAVDDTIRIITRVQPTQDLVKEMIGGGPFLLVDGEVDIGPRGDANDRHPRTAIGFSADSTKLILAAVDGRQSISIGMTLHELALLMQQAGAATAMNLDGGGSTTMVVRGDVVNSPSGGGERPVSNALGLFSTAPVGDINQIRISDRRVRLFRGTAYRVHVEVVDEFFNPLPLDSASLSFEADPQVGSIDDKGLLQVAASADSGYVRALYQGFEDSLEVVITDVGRIDISPKAPLTDTTRTIQFSVTAFDTDNVERSVSNSEFDWSSSNEVVGTVDSTGLFKGHASGETFVIVSHGDLRDSALVTVDVREGSLVLDSLDSVSDWEIAAENADPGIESIVVVDTARTLGIGAIALTYRYTPNQSASRVYLTRDIQISGVPDSISVDVWSNLTDHRIFFEVVDSRGNLFLRYPPGRRPDLPTDRFETVSASITSPGILYPIQFVRFGLQLAPSDEPGEQTGSVLLDNLRVRYPNATGTQIDEEHVPPVSVVLHPNFPNPFSRQTTFTYELDRQAEVVLEVFDLLGRRVDTIENGIRAAGRHEIRFEAKDLPSGIYFIRLQVGGMFRTRSISVIH